MRVDRSALALAARRAAPGYVALSLLLTVLLYLTRLVRLRRWAERLSDYRRPLPEWIDMYLKSVAAGAVTPLRVGELSRVVLLKETSLPLAERGKLVILDKLCDFLYLPLALAIVAGELPRFGIAPALAAAAIAVSAAAIGTAIYLTRGALSLRSVGEGIAITLFGFALFMGCNLSLFRSAGIALPAVSIIAVVTVSGILSNIPVSMNGLGVREAAFLALLTRYAVPPEPIAIVVMLELLLAIFFPPLLFAAWSIARRAVKRLASTT
jgi:uncharacterized membrane protein YbhN (UPF0104 family)